MIVLVKGHPVHCSSAFIELSGAVGDAALSGCLPTSTIHGIDHATASKRNPTSAAPPITADGLHLSIRIGIRGASLLSEPGTEGDRRDGAVSLAWQGGCRERKSKKECDDKRGSWWNLPRWTAKTDAELRATCALLILTTYMRIKKHLLTNWHAWINHRAIVKGTRNSLSWQTWQFSFNWQTSSG